MQFRLPAKNDVCVKGGTIVLQWEQVQSEQDFARCPVDIPIIACFPLIITHRGKRPFVYTQWNALTCPCKSEKSTASARVESATETEQLTGHLSRALLDRHSSSRCSSDKRVNKLICISEISLM